MFNIDNILNSKLLTEPWNHQYIDRFFEEEEFQKIQESSKILQEYYKDQIITANDCLNLAQVLDCIGDEVFDIILESNRKILDNIENIIKFYPNHNRYDDYISFPSFHILPPETDWQKIHDESKDKTVSIVVYLYPENSTGTSLYKNKDRGSFVKEIEWKSNSAMLFCGEEDVTWHDFCSKENPRVTLNYFIRTLKSKEFDQDDTNYIWTFGNGLKTFIPKNISKERLDMLSGGILFRKL